MQTLQQEVTKTFQFLSDKFEEMESENQAMKMQLVEQNRELLSANARIKTLKEKLDSLEQEKKGKNIVLMKVPAQNQKCDKNKIILDLMIESLNDSFDSIVLTETWKVSNINVSSIDGYISHYNESFLNQNDGVRVLVKILSVI
ncbi:hypothetical protein HHI36_004467, partial [Cryptolaemus montrouzieri]